MGINVYTRRGLIWHINKAQNQHLLQSIQSMSVNSTQHFANQQIFISTNSIYYCYWKACVVVCSYDCWFMHALVCFIIQFRQATTRSKTMWMAINLHFWVALFQSYYCRLKHARVCLIWQFTNNYMIKIEVVETETNNSNMVPNRRSTNSISHWVPICLCNRCKLCSLISKAINKWINI